MEEQKCVASNFFMAMSEKIELLKKGGEKFSLTKFTALLANQFQIGVSAGGNEKHFILSFQDDLFYLEAIAEEKVNGRPVFSKDDMTDYLLILANSGETPKGLQMFTKIKLLKDSVPN